MCHFKDSLFPFFLGTYHMYGCGDNSFENFLRLEISNLLRDVMLLVAVLCGLAGASLMRQIIRVGTRMSMSTGLDGVSSLFSRKRYEISPLLDSALFNDWLKKTTTRRCQYDADYNSRINVREIKRANKEVLDKIHDEVLTASTSYMAHENYLKIENLERIVKGGTQAVTSMEKFVQFDDGDDIKLQTKKAEVMSKTLPAKKKELAECNAQLQELLQQTPEYYTYAQALADKEKVYESLGLLQGENLVQIHQRNEGVKKNQSGKRFEDTAIDVVIEKIYPLISEKYGVDPSTLLVVPNFCAGMPSTDGSSAEIDCIVVSKKSYISKPKGYVVHVYAIVEFKRNPDDIGKASLTSILLHSLTDFHFAGEAFASYQPALNWLSGNKDTYDSKKWITKAYVNGHFDKPAIYICSNGEHLIFTSDSFSSLNKKPVSLCGETSQLFYDCIYFVTTLRPLDNVSSKHTSWILAKVSNDTIFDNELSDDAAIETLRCKALERFPRDKLTTLDLIRAYIHDNFTTNILVVD